MTIKCKQYYAFNPEGKERVRGLNVRRCNVMNHELSKEDV